MNIGSIARLVDRMIEEGFAIDNIAFGMGGGLLHQVNRDPLRFAMKANALRGADGNLRDVSKRPATDLTKGIKAGRQAVIRENGRLVSVRLDAIDPAQDQLKSVWRNGELLIRQGFDELEDRSEA